MMFLLLVSSALAAPLPVAVETVVFAFGDEAERITTGEVLRRIEGALIGAVPSVKARPPSFFEPTTPDAPLQLGLRVFDSDCRPTSETRIRCATSLEWTLYHRPTDTVVYRISLSATASAEDTAEAIVLSILDTASTLTGRRGFLDRLDAGFYPAAAPPGALRMCAAPNPVGASLVATNPKTRAWAVDAQGSVLVVGANTDPLRLHQGTGPWLEAALLTSAGSLALYHLPVEGGLVCADDAVALPGAPDGAATVGDALARLGQTRFSPPRAPQLLNDRLDTASRASRSLSDDAPESL